MSVRVRVLQALCAGVVSIAAVGSLAAQQRAGTEIRHFFGVPWGAIGESVEKAFGTPLMDQQTPDSVRVMIYKEEVQGVPILRLFYIDPGLGLVKGLHTIPYGPGRDCEVVFSKLKERMQQMYPGITPVESRRHGDPDVPFCESAANGEASWVVKWVDPVLGNFVEMALEPDGGHVDIVYQSRAFAARAQK